MTMFDLQKRVAFVTGGNGGIGLGMAKGLASAGAAVVIAGRNKTKAQSAVSDLRALGARRSSSILMSSTSDPAVMLFNAPPTGSAGSTSWSTTPGRPYASSRKT